MANGVELTIQLLAKSRNKAALRLLEAAVNSSREEVRKAAGKSLLANRGSKGALEIIRSYDPSVENVVEIILENRDKILPALRTAVGSDDRQLARNAFRIIYTQRFYEALPFLLTIFLEKGEDEADTFLSEGIYRLMNRYVTALEERKNRRFLYGTVLPEIVSVLTQGLKNFHRNDPDLLLLVFLQIYPYLTEEHKDLVQHLRNASSQTYLAVFRLLLERRDPAIYRFVFYCLDSPFPPPLALTVFSKRSDIPFISAFLKMLEEPVSSDMRANLAKLPRLEWLDNIRGLLDQLETSSQIGLVLLIQNLNLPVSETQSTLVDVIRFGRPEARGVALAALTKYSGDRVDNIVWEAAGDGDPRVQVEALKQLGKRDIPNANSRILQFVDSPDEQVRKTVQELLPNFRFYRFLETFDQMTEEQRRVMFDLVRKIDTQVVDELAQTLMIGQPVAKAKALLCVGYGSLVPQLEDTLCGVLTDDENPAIRAKAAELLALGRRELSRSTLVQAFHRDAAAEVRAAAKKSLEIRPVHWSSANDNDPPTDEDSPT